MKPRRAKLRRTPRGDITTLKQAEEALRQSEERFALVAAAALEGIYEWDIESGALFLTERAKALFAFPAQELTPAAWNARIHAEDHPRYRAAILEHFKGRTDHLEIEYRIADASGGYKWVLDRGKVVHDEAGRATKMVGALSDITQHKRAEIELRRARDEATEALEQQSSTAEILRVISSSPSDLKPVFDTILDSALRLCEAQHGQVYLYDGSAYELVDFRGTDVDTADHLRRQTTTGPHTGLGRILRERRPVHIPDLLDEVATRERDPMRMRTIEALGARTFLAVPLLKEQTVVGALVIYRREVRPFSDRQIALIKTFADQGVIAIENVRLFNETKQALERQTATAEILRVISASPGDVAPVFESILDNAVRLCDSPLATIFRYDGKLLHLVAAKNWPPEALEKLRSRWPSPPDPRLTSGRAILSGEIVRQPDTLADPTYDQATVPLGGWRTMLGIPLLSEGKPLGVLVVAWPQPNKIIDRHVDLLKTFADQAAIAIENVRLFNETTEAFEQQKASADILRVISSSIADTKPVFDAILESCGRLFQGHYAGIGLVGEDGLVHLAAYHGRQNEEFEKAFPVPLSNESATGRAILSREVVHYLINTRSVIVAPMLWEDRGVGGIFVGRHTTGPFSEKEIGLLKTFADQAVIAIQNAHLFREIHEKSQQLEIANRHKSEFLAHMSHELRTPLNAIIGFTRIVLRRSKEQLEPKQYENLEKILASGQHLLSLINAILDLSKVEAGRVEVNPAELTLGLVLEQCARTVEPLVKTDAVKLLREFDGALPQVYQDEQKLRQIVINLLSNAVKFTERGSVRLQAKCNGDSFAVAVADTGIGIPADKLEHIFEEFAQADASSTRVYGGTGLGLTIARRLARLMGGDIAVQSAPGAGSTFTLTLPVRYHRQA